MSDSGCAIVVYLALFLAVTFMIISVDINREARSKIIWIQNPYCVSGDYCWKNLCVHQNAGGCTKLYDQIDTRSVSLCIRKESWGNATCK
jgi:hypothetical protein